MRCVECRMKLSLENMMGSWKHPYCKDCFTDKFASDAEYSAYVDKTHRTYGKIILIILLVPSLCWGQNFGGLSRSRSKFRQDYSKTLTMSWNSQVLTDTSRRAWTISNTGVETVAGPNGLSGDFTGATTDDLTVEATLDDDWVKFTIAMWYKSAADEDVTHTLFANRGSNEGLWGYATPNHSTENHRINWFEDRATDEQVKYKLITQSPLTWHYIHFTYGGNGGDLWISYNGRSIAEVGTLADNKNPIGQAYQPTAVVPHFGHKYGVGDHGSSVNGWMASIGIWTKELSTAEILRDYMTALTGNKFRR